MGNSECATSRLTSQLLAFNHPLTTTRYGSETGLDGVAAEFLPMIKHLHEANYNVVMYDHRGQGDSDGGIGSKKRKVLRHQLVRELLSGRKRCCIITDYFARANKCFDDQIVFLSQCMGANATFLAWKNEPQLFSNPQIKGIIANQPTISYKMTDRFIKAKTGLNLVDKVLDKQLKNLDLVLLKCLTMFQASQFRCYMLKLRKTYIHLMKKHSKMILKKLWMLLLLKTRLCG